MRLTPIYGVAIGIIIIMNLLLLRWGFDFVQYSIITIATIGYGGCMYMESKLSSNKG